MHRFLSRRLVVFWFGAFFVLTAAWRPAGSACVLVAAKGQEAWQPAQKVFLDWEPRTKVETLVLQPSFESDAPDLGFVVPTPSRPEMVAVPREFFMELAVFTALSRRVFPTSSLKDPPPVEEGPRQGVRVKVLAEGIVGTRNYQIVTADKTEALAVWLREHGYDASSRKALDTYVEKKWCFTLFQNDPARTRKQADGVFAGEAQPIGLRFSSTEPIYPLRAARGTKDRLDVLFYVQAPAKMDLPGEGTYQYQWVPLLLNSRGLYPKGHFGDGDLPGKADEWLKGLGAAAPALVKKGEELGFGFVNRTRPLPNKQGRTAATLEWARQLTADDLRVLTNPAAYSERPPDPDEGFTVADLKNDNRREAIFQVIQRRLDRLARQRPAGYLVRAAPAEDVVRLKELAGWLHEGRFLTKFRKVFARNEIDKDVILIPARVGGAEDQSEYTESLPPSPP